MKKVTRYEDNSGNSWGTEKEALMSDARIILTKSLNKCLNGTYNLDEWIIATRKDPEVINALIRVLNIDFTEIQAEKLVKQYGEKT